MKRILSTTVLALLAGCGHQKDVAPKTQLEIRQIQSKSFETGQKNEVMNAVVEAFQDQGFMVKNAVPDIGLVVAQKEEDVQDGADAFFSVMAYGSQARFRKNAIIEATANVKALERESRVRVTFQHKVMDNQGGTVEDPALYQEFFNKVGKSLFIEKQKI